MSYVLDGYGKHRYQAPLVTQGLGIRFIQLPAGIVLGSVVTGYVLADAGRYPVLGQMICWMANAVTRTHGITATVLSRVWGEVRGFIDEL
jgi:hypothetical protein